MFTWLTKRLKGQGVSFLLIQPRLVDPINNKFSQLRHLIEPLIRGEGQIHLAFLEVKAESSLRYQCPWQNSMPTY